jgi:hypothetical protein
MPHPAERRTWARCEAVKNRSSMEFATPRGRQRIEARLVNISRDGALVVAEPPPLEATPMAADREPGEDRLGGRHDRSRRTKSTDRPAFHSRLS